MPACSVRATWTIPSGPQVVYQKSPERRRIEPDVHVEGLVFASVIMSAAVSMAVIMVVFLEGAAPAERHSDQPRCLPQLHHPGLSVELPDRTGQRVLDGVADHEDDGRARWGQPGTPSAAANLLVDAREVDVRRGERWIFRHVELAVATGQVAALQDEIKRHELVYDMLDGRKTAKRSPQGRSGAGASKWGPRGAMIDWTAVFETLPDQFTLDSLLAHKTAAEKTRAYLRQWSRGGRRKPGSGAPAGACTSRRDSEETGRDRRRRVPTRPFALAVSTVCIRTSPLAN